MDLTGNGRSCAEKPSNSDVQREKRRSCAEKPSNSGVQQGKRAELRGKTEQLGASKSKKSSCGLAGGPITKGSGVRRAKRRAIGLRLASEAAADGEPESEADGGSWRSGSGSLGGRNEFPLREAGAGFGASSAVQAPPVSEPAPPYKRLRFRSRLRRTSASVSEPAPPYKRLRLQCQLRQASAAGDDARSTTREPVHAGANLPPAVCFSSRPHAACGLCTPPASRA